MKQKLLLSLIAGALVLIAVGAVVSGVVVSGVVTPDPDEAEQQPQLGVVERTQPEASAPVGPTTPAAAQPTVQPTGQPETAESFIRFGVATPPARLPGTVRVATYNTENLFDAVDDPTLFGRNEDIDDAKPEAQLQSLADTIRALDADVLALEEIESEAVLVWFRDTYLADLGYTHVASIDAGDERGIEQAVLSRYPIESVTNWLHLPLGGTHPEKWGSGENWNAGKPITFHRSPLRVVVDIPAGNGSDAAPYKLTLFVVHSKSGRPGEYWRIAEAKGLAGLLADEAAANPNANIVVLGDFNAFLRDESVQTLMTAAHLTDALAAVDDHSPRYKTHESGRSIDHILINANLRPELVATSPFVLGTPSLPEGVDWREEWRADGYASDHFPVAIDITPVEHRAADSDANTTPNGG